MVDPVPVPYEALPPVKRGWVRGDIRNLVTEQEETQYGSGKLWTFNVVPRDGGESVAVQMRGLESSGRLFEGSLVEIYHGDSAVRPVAANYIYMPTADMMMLVHYPGQPTPRPPDEDRWPKWVLAAAAIVAIIAILWGVWLFM